MSTIHDQAAAAPHDSINNRKVPPANQLEGTFVSMTGNHMVMTDKDGNKQAHTLAKDARLTCDGAACQAQDLKAGHQIRVTMRQDVRNLAIGIESLDKAAEFAPRS